MILKQFKDKELSLLGLGAMRLPTIDGNDAIIDQVKVQDMVAYAIEKGINYFDTAWGYHGGNSEISIGKALSKYPRNTYYLASKFPGYDLSNMSKIDEIFNKQLEKCGVDYFDFYLFHNVCEMNIDAYLNDDYGLYQYLIKQKQLGRIKHLGFSIHGDYDILVRFLDAYGKDMEFCQIQLNYIDYKFQKADMKMDLLKKYNIPIWVMEPLRGGKLASMSVEARDVLPALQPTYNAVEWAFRYLQSYDNVKVILSGMSNYEQLQENIDIFETNQPLSNQELDGLLTVADKMVAKFAIPCTNCKYCISKCPMGLDIPDLLELYNEFKLTDGGFIAPMALAALPDDKKPQACIGCQNCETVCPQQIEIASNLAEFVSKLG